MKRSSRSPRSFSKTCNKHVNNCCKVSCLLSSLHPYILSIDFKNLLVYLESCAIAPLLGKCSNRFRILQIMTMTGCHSRISYWRSVSNLTIIIHYRRNIWRSPTQPIVAKVIASNRLFKPTRMPVCKALRRVWSTSWFC